jgi:hypothetical protein
MSALYVIVWIGYAFYYMNKGTTKDEAIVGLIAGLFYGAIWPVMIPLEVYSSITKKSVTPYVPPTEGEGFTIADLQKAREEVDKKDNSDSVEINNHRSTNSPIVTDSAKLNASKDELDLLDKYLTWCTKFNELSVADRYSGVNFSRHMLASAASGGIRPRDVPSASMADLQKIKSIFHPNDGVAPSEIVGHIIWQTFLFWKMRPKYTSNLIEANWQVLTDSFDYSEEEYIENQNLLRLYLSVESTLDLWK